MSITFDQKTYTFKLDTTHTTYIFRCWTGDTCATCTGAAASTRPACRFCPGNIRAPMSETRERWRNAPIL